MKIKKTFFVLFSAASILPVTLCSCSTNNGPIYQKYSAAYCSVIFLLTEEQKSSGATIEGQQQIQVKNQKPFGSIITPSVLMEGDSPMGWSPDGSIENILKPDTLITKNMTLYPVFDPGTVAHPDVSFVLSPEYSYIGETEIKLEEHLEFKNIYKPEAVKNNYFFLEWEFASPVSTFKAGDKIPDNFIVKQNISIKPYFADSPVGFSTITFEMNGAKSWEGSTTMLVSNTSSFDVINKPTSVQKPENKFLGWFLDQECKNSVPSNFVFNKNKTIYAGWEETAVIISFTSDPGIVIKSPKLVVEKGTTFKNAKTEYTLKTSFLFEGWYLNGQEVQDDFVIDKPYEFEGRVFDLSKSSYIYGYDNNECFYYDPNTICSTSSAITRTSFSSGISQTIARNEFSSTVYVGNENKTIGANFLASCSNFSASVNIAEGITNIGNSFLANITSGSPSVTLPNGLLNIGNYFLSNVYKQSLPSLPPTLTTIGSHFCENTKARGDYTIPASVTSIGEYFLYNCRFGTQGLSLPPGHSWPTTRSDFSGKLYMYCQPSAVKSNTKFLAIEEAANVAEWTTPTPGAYGHSQHTQTGAAMTFATYGYADSPSTAGGQLSCYLALYSPYSGWVSKLPNTSYTRTGYDRGGGSFILNKTGYSRKIKEFSCEFPKE